MKKTFDDQLTEIEIDFLKAKQRLLAIEHKTLCEELRNNRAERKKIVARLKVLANQLQPVLPF